MNATADEKITAQPHEPRDATRGNLPPKTSRLLRRVLGAAIAFAVVLTVLAGLIQKWLWMRELDYVGIFWTLLSVKWGMFGVALVFGILYLWINLRFATKNIDISQEHMPLRKVVTPASDAGRRIDIRLSSKLLIWGIGVAVTVVSLIFALGVATQWDTYLRFRYGGSFGVADPLFGVDLGFYFFRLPFYELLQSSLTVLTVAALATLGFVAFLGRWQSKEGRNITIGDKTVRHLGVLLFILAANFGWGFYLDHYELVYSTLGVVYGAGYAAAHVTRIALWMMAGASALACALLVLTFFRPRVKALTVGIGIFAALYVVGVWALPHLFDAYVVQPSELSLETPYLGHYIESTRKAYNLEAIQETAYPALTELTPEVLGRNQDTIQNIRLWDSRPLLQTYQQTQAIRLYYQFYILCRSSGHGGIWIKRGFGGKGHSIISIKL